MLLIFAMAGELVIMYVRTYSRYNFFLEVVTLVTCFGGITLWAYSSGVKIVASSRLHTKFV